MDKVFEAHQVYINKGKSLFKRYLIDQINWNSKLIGIKGAKGVGKTTMILQHIWQKFGTDAKALYVTMDSILVKSYTLFEIAERHIQKGGTHLFLDEIHKYPEWSRELKTIHDMYPDLYVTFSGSSILQIYKSYADLSRRATIYSLEGLSFREFINFEHHTNLPSYTLDDVLKNHTALSQEFSKKYLVLNEFEKYNKLGYFPFYKEDTNDFSIKLDQIINAIIDVDLPFILEISVHNLFKMKKLLQILSSETPFQLNITKLAASLELNRNTTYNYIYYLEQAKLLTVILDSGKSYSTLSKPEKVFLQNPNFLYALSNEKVNPGTLREMFFINQVSVKNKVYYSKVGDFNVDNKFTFEIGGAGKSFKQIAGIENSFIAADNILIGTGNKIPLWLFGFLY